MIWGISEEQFAAFGLTIGVGAFMLFVFFIIGQLAWTSKAGKLGTFVIFLAWLLACWALQPKGSSNGGLTCDLFLG